jgi:hypothetical protein
MQRRKLLSAIGIGAVSIPGISSAAPEASENGKNKPPQRTVTLKEIDGIDHEDVTANLWLSRAEVTKEDSAKLEMELKNTGSDSWELGRTAKNSANGFRGVRDRGNIPAMFLGTLNKWEPKNGRWEANENEHDTSKRDVHVTETIGAGTLFRNQFELWSLPKSQYLPPGTYKFGRKIEIDGQNHDLSFKIEISND